MPAPISLVQGTDRGWVLQATTDGVTPVTTFLASDALTGRVWLGEDQPTLFVPAVAWVDAATGKFQVSFAAAQTAGMLAGTYYLQALATRGTQSVALTPDGFTVEITPAPGSAAALTAYCTARDMGRLAPWVTRLQTQVDLTGFAQARQDARNWFDDLLHRHWRGGQGLSADFNFVPGLAFVGTDRFLMTYRSGVRSIALTTWLAGGGLMLTSEVIKANAAYAIAQVAKGQIVPGNDKSSAYASFYAHFETLAETTASLITAEIDTDGDGLTDTFIRLGIADTLEG